MFALAAGIGDYKVGLHFCSHVSLSLATTAAAFGWFVVRIGNSAMVTEAEKERN
jgi:hypothetical protein